MNIEFLSSPVVGEGDWLWNFGILIKLINRGSIFTPKNVTPEWIEILVLTGYYILFSVEKCPKSSWYHTVTWRYGVSMSNWMTLRNFVKLWIVVTFFAEWFIGHLLSKYFSSNPFYENPCKSQSVSERGELSGKGFLYQGLFVAWTTSQREKKDRFVHSTRLLMSAGCDFGLSNTPTHLLDFV